MRSKYSGRIYENEKKETFIAMHKDQVNVPKGKVSVQMTIEKPTLFPDITETETVQTIIERRGLKLIGFFD